MSQIASDLIKILLLGPISVLQVIDPVNRFLSPEPLVGLRMVRYRHCIVVGQC